MAGKQPHTVDTRKPLQRRAWRALIPYHQKYASALLRRPLVFRSVDMPVQRRSSSTSSTRAKGTPPVRQHCRRRAVRRSDQIPNIRSTVRARPTTRQRLSSYTKKTGGLCSRQNGYFTSPLIVWENEMLNMISFDSGVDMKLPPSTQSPDGAEIPVNAYQNSCKAMRMRKDGE